MLWVLLSTPKALPEPIPALRDHFQKRDSDLDRISKQNRLFNVVIYCVVLYCMMSIMQFVVSSSCIVPYSLTFMWKYCEMHNCKLYK